MVRKEELSGDLWGGIAAALVALPASIGFGVAIYAPLGGTSAAYGALAGILGAIGLGIVAPLFGGAPRLITAPCAPAAAILSGLALELITAKEGFTPFSPERASLLLILVGLLCGALQLLYGAMGAGRLIKYIPYPVVAGYLTAVGIQIVWKQLPSFLGVAKKDLFSPGMWNLAGIVVGVVTVTGMAFGRKITKRVPAAIIGLAGGIGTYFALGAIYPELLQLAGNKSVVGPLIVGGGFFEGFKDRWITLVDLHMADFRIVLSSALTLSVLLSIDTLKTCVVMDALTRSRHESNRELLGQGLANLISGFAGGTAGAGTMGATLVNLNSGAKTRLSSIIEGVSVLVAFALLSKWIAWIPIAALAGILMVLGFRMVDRSMIHLLKQRSTVFDFVVILVVVIVALAKDLIAAAGAGLGLAILLFIREMIRGSVIRRKLYGNQISSKRDRLPAEKEYLHGYGTAITVCELQGSLFFGTTDQLFSQIEPDLKLSRYVILDMRRIQSVDFTAVHMLEQIEAMLSDRNGTLIFSSLPATVPTNQDLRTYFNQVGLIKPAQNVKLFDSLDAALEWAEDRVLEEQRLLKFDHDTPLDLPEIELLRELESEGVLTSLKSCIREVSYAPGDTIFKKGDGGDELYLIRRGIVRILLPLEGNRFYNLATFARGNFFGDMAFLDHSKRSADAVAVTDTELFIMSRRDFDQIALKNPSLGSDVFVRLARALAVRLRYTTSELRALQEA